MQVYAYTSASTLGVLILSALVLVQCASSAIWSHQQLHCCAIDPEACQ